MGQSLKVIFGNIWNKVNLHRSATLGMPSDMSPPYWLSSKEGTYQKYWPIFMPK